MHEDCRGSFSLSLSGGVCSLVDDCKGRLPCESCMWFWYCSADRTQCPLLALCNWDWDSSRDGVSVRDCSWASETRDRLGAEDTMCSVSSTGGVGSTSLYSEVLYLLSRYSCIFWSVVIKIWSKSGRLRAVSFSHAFRLSKLGEDNVICTSTVSHFSHKATKLKYSYIWNRIGASEWSWYFCISVSILSGDMTRSRSFKLCITVCNSAGMPLPSSHTCTSKATLASEISLKVICLCRSKESAFFINFTLYLAGYLLNTFSNLWSNAFDSSSCTRALSRIVFPATSLFHSICIVTLLSNALANNACGNPSEVER